jgi:hypothetical protein
MDMRAVLAFPISYTLLPVTVTRLGPCRLCPLTINQPVSPLFSGRCPHHLISIQYLINTKEHL